MLDLLKSRKEKLDIFSPMNGDTICLDEIDDPVFSKHLIGEGIAVCSKENNVFSPVDGIVVATTRTKHALVMKLQNGIELLIHVGTRSNQLDGDEFLLYAKEGTPIAKGDLLMTFDFNKVSIDNKVCVMLIVLNSKEHPLSDLCIGHEVRRNTEVLFSVY